jgi:hypothetical protein
MTILEKTSADRARRRLVVLVEHLIAHSKDHAEELAAERALVSQDPIATDLLEVALHDLATAHRALGAFLHSISGAD